MDAFFERVLQISLSGSVIVLAVLALRLVLKNAPKRAVCLLWMLAVLRLLVPFEIQSDWSMQPPPPEFAPPQVQQEYLDSGTAQSPVPPEYLENTVEYPLEQPSVPVKITDVLPWLWLLGAVLLVVHGAVSYIRLKRRVRDAVILEEGVWLCAGLDTAFVLGFFRPQIYLPVLEQEERELVLLHERCHIRRLDHWWKLLAYAAVSIHWFNPLAWVTYILMCRDMELACDQETVKSMDNAKRKAYSAALLNCAAKRSGIAACPVAFGEISVKERINMVLHYKKPGFWVTVIALVAAMAVGVFLLTSPRVQTDLDQCQNALEKWQGMESIHLHISTVHKGDLALNSWTVTEYWASGGNALMMECIDDHNRTTTWKSCQDGKVYIAHTWEEEGDTVFQGWEEDPDSQQWNLPWIIREDWSEWQFTHLRTDSTELSTDIHLKARHPEKDGFEMVLSFEGDELKQVRRTFTSVVEDDREQDGVLAAVSDQTIILMDTDWKTIENAMNVNGPDADQIRFYNEPRVRREEFICTDSGDHCLSGHGHDTHH